MAESIPAAPAPIMTMSASGLSATVTTRTTLLRDLPTTRKDDHDLRQPVGSLDSRTARMEIELRGGRVQKQRSELEHLRWRRSLVAPAAACPLPRPQRHSSASNRRRQGI